jgi:hypothetical protein
MKVLAMTVLAALALSACAQAQGPAGLVGSETRICADQAHGQERLPAPYGPLAIKLAAAIVAIETPATAAVLKGCRVLLLRVPLQEITSDERAAMIAFVREGGSMLLAFDEERRAPLETSHVNDVIAPFGLKLTADTEYLHNTGAIVKRGEISSADRELPFSGGRAVEGGSPFGWQLDKNGAPNQVFAASTTVGKTGKVVVLSDAMVTLFLGTADGVRLTGVPRNPLLTTYWGKDSAIFMEELLTWLIK